MLTKRSTNICQGAPLGEYIMMYDVARPTILPTDNKNAEHLDGKYRAFLSIVQEHNHQMGRNYKLFIHKNALLIQGLIDAQAALPQYLSERLNDYVNKCTWRAIEKVFSNTLICDMKYYQDEYRKKMDVLGIEYNEKSGIVTNEAIANAKRYEYLSIKLEELQYDILPRQQKSAARVEAKNPENETAQERAASRLAQTQVEIEATKAEMANLTSQGANQPARTILYNTFHSHGQLVTPTISKNPIGQFVFLAQLRKCKTRTK